MSWQDTVAEKRRIAEEQKAGNALHKESIDAVVGSSEKVAKVTEKATKGLATSQDIDAMIEQLKEVLLAQLMSASTTKPDKPTVILTDQTDLGDRLTKMVEGFSTSLSQLNSSTVDNKQLGALEELKAAIEAFNKNQELISRKQNQELLKAVKNIEITPVVNVPTPEVKVAAPKIDLKSLEAVLTRYAPLDTPDPEIDLDCYKAQDIDNSAKDMQYVGFVNPDGNWYIVENSIRSNSLRYVFGNAGYEKAFENASSYEYKLLNEAIDAVST